MTTQRLGIEIVAIDKTAQAFTSVKRVTDAVQGVGNAVKGMAGPMAQAERSTALLGSRLQNASFQISDFAVQVGSGTDATRALAQQLPQVLGGLGVFGAVAGAAVAILLPLAQSLSKTRDYAKELADGVDKLDAAQKISTATIVDLTEEYGRYASVISSVARTQEELAKSDITRALVDQATAVLELNAAYAGTAGVFGEVANQMANMDFSRSAIAQLFAPLDEVSNKVNFLKDKFSLTEEAARGVLAPFSDFQIALKNTNTEAAALALEQFSRWIKQNRDDAASAIPIFQQMQSQFLALSKLSPIPKDGMGFSFTPLTPATGFNNYEGNTKVAEQLAEMEKRAADAKKAVAEASRLAAEAQRRETTEFEAFINAVDRGVTPLQRMQETLQQAEENFARFGDNMKPEQVEAYTAYIADLGVKIDDLTFREKWDEMSAGIQTATAAMAPFAQAVADIGKSISDSLVSGLTDAFSAFIDGTKSAEDAFKQFAVSFLEEITAMIIKSLLLYAIQMALGAVQGSFAFGSLMQSFGGIYGKGGAFSGGKPVTAFAAGGVVGGPTVFPMAGGRTGLMGEAGPEAIVPLSRHNGKLGVGASPVNVTVINNSSASVSTSRNPDGGLTIAVEEAVANMIARGGSKIDAAMSRGYGLRRAGR